MRKPAASQSPGVSLARALSKLGVASRTQAATLIEAGRVTVNGRVVSNPNLRINMDSDSVTLDGAPLRAQSRRYLMLNKPRGLVTTARDEKGRPTVYQCLHESDRQLAPVGRLDMASEGLLLFTNDTRWAHALLAPDSHLPKTYHVQIDRVPDESEINRLRHGIEIEPGVVTRPAQVSLLRSGGKSCWLEIILIEGMNRQIRRMLEAIGAETLHLVRIRIGPLELGDLAKGQTRPLTAEELAQLQQAIGK